MVKLKRKSQDIRYSKSISFTDALSAYTKEHHLDKKLESVRVTETFMQAIPISARNDIQRVEFSNGILKLHIQSASLRQNLKMASTSLIDIINEKLNETIVYKILLH